MRDNHRKSWRRHPARLRTRVLAGIMAVTLVTLAAFDVAAVTQLHRYLISQADEQLRNVVGLYGPLNRPVLAPEANALAPKANVNAPTPGLAGASTSQILQGSVPFPTGPTRITAIGPRLVLPSKLSNYFVTYNGAQSYAGGDTALAPTSLGVGTLLRLVKTHTGWTGTSWRPGVPVRIMATQVNNGYFIATVSLAGVNHTVGQLKLILIIGSVLAALAVALAGGWLIRRGLRPLEAMAAQADRITAGNLTDRVGPAGARTEVGRLGAALDGMLTRIGASVAERDASQEATRRFFADASHELRNPLASLCANAELYAEGAIPDRAGVDEAMRRIGLEAQRMSALVDDMLRLARIDQHPGQRHDRVDLTALVTSCAERAQLAHPRQAWQLDIADGLVTEGDEEMLRRAIDNLLTNVCVHTPDGTTGTITAAPGRSGTVTVEVSDDGPGVPPSQLSRIFDRFYRASAPAGRPGSGLGLSIVAAIAAAHHGTAGAALNQPRGLTLTLTLPLPEPPGGLPASAPQTVAGPVIFNGDSSAGRIPQSPVTRPGVLVPAGRAPAPSRPASRVSRPGLG
jgi:two-component system OmpR family sensor kinase